MEERTKGLSGNQLKLIALICMTIDHVGYILLPRIVALRAIGRLAFPIYAYMIAGRAAAIPEAFESTFAHC